MKEVELRLTRREAQFLAVLVGNHVTGDAMQLWDKLLTAAYGNTLGFTYPSQELRFSPHLNGDTHTTNYNDFHEIEVHDED